MSPDLTDVIALPAKINVSTTISVKNAICRWYCPVQPRFPNYAFTAAEPDAERIALEKMDLTSLTAQDSPPMKMAFFLTRNRLLSPMINIR